MTKREKLVAALLKTGWVFNRSVQGYWVYKHPDETMLLFVASNGIMRTGYSLDISWQSTDEQISHVTEERST